MKKWLYFLVDDQGRSYKKNGSVIQQVSQPTSLPNSPDGWQEISIGWERNMNRFGIIRNFSLPLGFVKAANDILRYVYLTGTVESKVFLLIKYLSVELTVSTFKMIYRFFYKGELDLSTIEVTDSKTTVNIMEGGISKDLAANEGTTFEFPLDDPEAVNINTDGMLIRITGNYAAMEQDITANNDYFFPMAYLNSDQVTDATVLHQTCFYEQVLSSPQLALGTNYFLRLDPVRVREFRIYGEIKINNTAGINKNFGFQIRSQSDVYYAPGSTSYTPGQHTITFDETITIGLPTIVPQAFFIQIVPGQADVDIERSLIYTEYDYRYPPTVTKAFTLATLYRKLVGKVTGSEANAASDLLELYKNICISCGDELRKLDGAVIKTSLKDCFDAANVWLNAGMSIENKKLRLESKTRYFNDSATPFHLGKAKNLRITTATDLMCNTLKVGYAEQDVSAAWGRFEFNNTSLFTSPVKKVVKEFSLIAPYRTDPSGIEETRINLSGKTTTDANTDNDVFALIVDIYNPNIDGSYNLLRPAFSTLDGVPAESQLTVFNIEIFTPKRILKTHGSWLRSIFYGFETSKLKFETTQKNRNLRTILAGITIDEDADETIGNLEAPLFKPYYLEFECQSPKTIVEILDTDPNQPFSFEWEGETFKGFLIKAGIAPDSNKEQTIKLLCSPSNDMTKFI